MDMMPKKIGIKMVELSEVKKKKPIIETARVGGSTISDGFWCVRHQHWASSTNGIGWKNDSCRSAYQDSTSKTMANNEFWCTVHNHWATRSSCTPDCKLAPVVGGNRNDMPVELL
jgi:hypothetical protein